MTRHTRRTVLRTTGGLASTAALASVAGCSSIPFLGGGGASYTQWLYEPGTLTDDEHYSFFFQKPAKLADNEDEFNETTYKGLSRTGENVGRLGLDFGDLKTSLSFQSATVLTGDYKVSDVESKLEDAGYSDDDEVGDYTVWLNEKQGSAYGVSGNAIVSGRAGFSGDTKAADVVTTTIETKRGNETRYADASDDFSTAVNKVGSGHLVTGGSQKETEKTNVKAGQFAGQVANSARFKVKGSTTKLKSALVFADGSDVDMDKLQEYVDKQKDSDSSLLADADSVNTSKSGRVAILKATVPTDAI